MNIIICGDISPTRKYSKNFKHDILLSEEVLALLTSSFSIANLESPLTLNETPAAKAGPNLKGIPSNASELRKMGINALSLANNHIMDFGETGLYDTIEACESNSLHVFGAGLNLSDAMKPFLCSIGNKSVCFMGFSDYEFCIANSKSPGAAPADYIGSLSLLHEYRMKCDHIIVLLHAGKALYALPTPETQKYSRFLVDHGASAVICQHSHCIGAVEEYKNGLIVYGQGNCIFDGLKSAPDCWYTGYFIQLDLSNKDKISFQLLPFRQHKEQPYIRLMKGEERRSIINWLNEMKKKTIDSEYIHNKWIEYVIKERDLYLSLIAGHGRIVRYANRKLHFLTHYYRGVKKRYLLNIIRSSIHRESLITILEEDNKH